MKFKTIVSIIIPVYNAEKHLSDCIHSILNQTYKQIEIILINDGSTDESGTICNDHMKQDHRIKVIHQPNAGPAHARNTGINQAMGTYIQFVDADDTIEPQMTEQLLTAMTENVQLVLCGYKSVTKQAVTHEFIPPIAGIFPKNTFMQHFGELYKGMLLPSPCNKLYLTETINEQSIRFTENLTMGEDLLFNLAYINVCKRMNVIKQPLYNYLIVSTSITRSYNKDLQDNQKMLYTKVRNFLIKENCYAGENKHFLHVINAHRIVYSLNNLFHKDNELTPEQKKKQIAAIISDKDLKQNETLFAETIQSYMVGQMVKYKTVRGIYWFFTMKRLLQYRLPSFFYLLKRVNKSEGLKQ